ncbi:hypothetical protein E2C01_067560 [Portunus trituberculatus]|uniref:Uncharacterized protein n=1 Tax=Portunus trituberculatus TaxID=210409 RepID=A0A5B7HX21_PORTR|nr:hypothetical protein [Portunus trituberculatus]
MPLWYRGTTRALRAEVSPSARVRILATVRVKVSEWRHKAIHRCELKGTHTAPLPDLPPRLQVSGSTWPLVPISGVN